MIPSKKTISPKTRNLIPVIMGAGIFLILLSVLLLLLLVPVSRDVVPDNEVHLHADFALFLNGQKYNFSQEKYMDGPVKPEGNAVHLHDGDGDVIHVHAPGITLGTFFTSLGMSYETTARTITLTLDDGTTYTATRFGCFTDTTLEGNPTLCVDPAPTADTFSIYVNGKPLLENMKGEDYVIQDVDKIVISFHQINEDISSQLAQITDKACIQSNLCPEKGTPSDESSCVTGGECGVTHIA